MGFGEELRATQSTNPPEWYLDCARQCMERAQLMTSSKKNGSTKVKIHYNQCKYLVDTLKMVIEAICQVLGPLYAKTQTQTQTHTHTKLGIGSSSSQHKTKSNYQLGVLMLLWKSSTEIERFIKDCCSINWLKIAITLGSVAQSSSVSVSTWGYHLRVCSFILLDNNILGGTSLSMADIDTMKEAELLSVEEKASIDHDTLLNTLSVILSSNTSTRADEFQLATILQKRLEVRKAMLATTGHLERSLELLKIDSRAVGHRENLGRGGFANVYKCTWYGAKVAMKSIWCENQLQLADFMREISVLGSLSHPNIVHMLGYSHDERELTIMMELMDGSLSSLMQKRLQSLPNDSTPFNIHETLDLLLQVANGMDYIHQNNIVHRDLKPENILVRCVKATNLNHNVPELLYAKVADFGVSKTKLKSMTYSHQTKNVGTIRYMAPEVRRQTVVDEVDQHETPNYPYKSDIYGFAMICFDTLTGNIPFPTLGPKEMSNAILQGDRPRLPQHCPQALKTLIEACWHPNPTSRPSSTQICQTLRWIKYTSLIDNDGESQARQQFQEAHPVPEPQHIAKEFDFSRLSVVKIENSCLHRGIQLGKGGQETVVYKTIHHQSKVAQICVAQKRFVPAYNEDFQNEITILSYLKHPNIISLVGYALDNRSCSIILELMDGDLHHDLMCRKMENKITPRGPFTIDDAIRIMLQIAQAMDYVHQKNVVHMDLKSYNILVRQTNMANQLVVKVADFGLAKQLKPGSHLHFNVGTPSWMSPELMRLNGTTRRRTSNFFYFSNAMGNIPLMSQERVKKFHDPFKSDIYSFGMLCFEILTGNAPTFHLKNGRGNALQKDPQNVAIFLLFLFLEGLIKLKEDPQKTTIVVVLLLKGLNFKKDPHKAIISLIVLHLKFKIKKDQNEVLKEKVMVGHRPILPEYCPPKLKALIESCWDKDASTRPTFAQIIMSLKDLM